MDALAIECVYEGGVLMPDRPLPFRERERVQITVWSQRGEWVRRTAGIVRWASDPETLERLATLPEFDPQERP